MSSSDDEHVAATPTSPPMCSQMCCTRDPDQAVVLTELWIPSTHAVILPESYALCVFLVRTQVFNDPIHGHIELDPICVMIIDTPQVGFVSL
jgi:hypothetical protein